MDEVERLLRASLRIEALSDEELMAAQVALCLGAARLPVTSLAAVALFGLSRDLQAILAARDSERSRRG
jgi:hypothetical protein